VRWFRVIFGVSFLKHDMKPFQYPSADSSEGFLFCCPQKKKKAYKNKVFKNDLDVNDENQVILKLHYNAGSIKMH